MLRSRSVGIAPGRAHSAALVPTLHLDTPATGGLLQVVRTAKPRADAHYVTGLEIQPGRVSLHPDLPVFELDDAAWSILVERKSEEKEKEESKSHLRALIGTALARSAS